MQKFVYDKVEVPDGLIENSGRELNREFQEKLIGQIMAHYARKFLLPAPFRAVYTGIKSLGYIWKGLQTLAQRKLEVPVLDATQSVFLFFAVITILPVPLCFFLELANC